MLTHLITQVTTKSVNIISDRNKCITLGTYYENAPWIQTLSKVKMNIVYHCFSQLVLKKNFGWFGDLLTHLRTELMTKSVKKISIFTTYIKPGHNVNNLPWLRTLCN